MPLKDLWPFNRSVMAEDEPKVEIYQEPEKQVTVAVDGCVINWEKQLQVNPKTGETFDFEGRRQ